MNSRYVLETNNCMPDGKQDISFIYTKKRAFFRTLPFASFQDGGEGSDRGRNSRVVVCKILEDYQVLILAVIGDFYSLFCSCIRYEELVS